MTTINPNEPVKFKYKTPNVFVPSLTPVKKKIFPSKDPYIDLVYNTTTQEFIPLKQSEFEQLLEASAPFHKKVCNFYHEVFNAEQQVLTQQQKNNAENTALQSSAQKKQLEANITECQSNITQQQQAINNFNPSSFSTPVLYEQEIQPYQTSINGLYEQIAQSNAKLDQLHFTASKSNNDQADPKNEYQTPASLRTAETTLHQELKPFAQGQQVLAEILHLSINNAVSIAKDKAVSIIKEQQIHEVNLFNIWRYLSQDKLNSILSSSPKLSVEVNGMNKKEITYGDIKTGLLDTLGLKEEDVAGLNESNVNAYLTGVQHQITKDQTDSPQWTGLDNSNEAKMMRYMGVYLAEYPIKRQTGYSFDLYKANYSNTTNLPNKNGVELIIEAEQEQLSFGVFKLALSSKLYRYAGASVLASMNVDVTEIKMTETTHEEAGRVDPNSNQNGSIGIPSSVSADVGAFAGVAAGNEYTAKLEWGEPTENYTGDQYIVNVDGTAHGTSYIGTGTSSTSFNLFGNVELTYAATIGIGAQAGFEFGYDTASGQFTFAISAALAYEAGSKGAFRCTVQPSTMKDMAVFIYQQIKNSNFNVNLMLKHVMNKEAYYVLSKLFVTAIWAGDTLESFTSQAGLIVDNLQAYFERMEGVVAQAIGLSAEKGRLQNRANALELANNIISNNENIINNATPAAKGRLLYTLVQYLNTNIFEAQDSAPADAIQGVLGSIDTAPEFLQVLTNIVDINDQSVIPAIQGAKLLKDHSGLSLLGLANSIDEKVRAEYIRVLQHTDKMIQDAPQGRTRSDMQAALAILFSISNSGNVYIGLTAWKVSPLEINLYVKNQESPELSQGVLIHGQTF